MSSQVDRLYLQRESAGADFKFDTAVAAVFDNMIERSVPLYREAQRVTAELAQIFVRPGTAVVDIGCSTGTTLLALAPAAAAGEFRLVGLDSSAPMLEQCRNKLEQAGMLGQADLILADISEGLPPIVPAPSVAVLNYTLQFIAPEHRPAVLRSICSALPAGGCLILSEKICAEDPDLNRVITDLHHSFKRENGYSDLEISRKRDALEQVLIPWSFEQNKAALLASGFSRVEAVLKWYQFTTFAALK